MSDGLFPPGYRAPHHVAINELFTIAETVATDERSKSVIDEATTPGDVARYIGHAKVQTRAFMYDLAHGHPETSVLLDTDRLKFHSFTGSNIGFALLQASGVRVGSDKLNADKLILRRAHIVPLHIIRVHTVALNPDFYDITTLEDYQHLLVHSWPVQTAHLVQPVPSDKIQSLRP